MGTLFAAGYENYALAAELVGIRKYEPQNATRIVFDTSEAINYKIFHLDNPNRIVIDLFDTNESTNFDIDSAQLSSSRFVSYRVAKRARGYRIVIVTDRKIPYKYFTLEPAGNYEHRLVVDLQTEQELSIRKADIKRLEVSYGDVKVVLDPGHGGRDPGAVGQDGTLEKKVVLEIARRVKNKIDAKLGFSAIISRPNDKYVSLVERTELARENRAHCFISLHADAFKSPNVFGASVYMLSEKGATDETAKWLQNIEQQSHLIGGKQKTKILTADGEKELNDYERQVGDWILDMAVSYSLPSSNQLGQFVLAELGRVTPLHKKTVQKAAFVVLKRPDVPSILIEAGFISNPREAKRLTQFEHQEKLSRAIADGVEKFFRQNPPINTLLRHADETKKYLVVRGDTLSEISARFGVSVRAIRRANKLSNNTIRIGQSLIIPPVIR